MTSNDRLLVQAIYSFKGKNNDELCFKKGDIIVIIQIHEEGWSEGKLGDKTGWFPSNYVREYKPEGENKNMKISNMSIDLTEQLKVNRSVVVFDIIDSEQAHVSELQTLIQSFLIPIKKSNIMSIDEYNQLINNIEEICKIHEELLESLKNISKLPQSDQRIGKLFVNKSLFIKNANLKYCCSHPRAITIVEKYKEDLNQIMESNGARNPGILVLTVSLSKPFRRLEKYHGILLELERHLEDNHIDRVDVHHSIDIYKEIATACLSARKQKELELSIFNGIVRGWNSSYNIDESIKIGSVAFSSDHKVRYLMLFPKHLVILSVSQRLSSFTYEGKIQLSGACAKKVDCIMNAFEISGPSIDTITAICQSKDEQVDWILKINNQIENNCVFNKTSGKIITNIDKNNRITTWDVTRLRPNPPIQYYHYINEKKLYLTKSYERSFDDDSKILKVFEAFCLSAKLRHTSSGD